MADVEKKQVEQQQEQIHKIRITLASSNVKQIERISANIIQKANDFKLYKKGPVRIPTKVLKIATRKTPNGEGSKTWDTYEFRIHKRFIDLQAPTTIVKKITQITIEPGVDVEVTIASSQ